MLAQCLACYKRNITAFIFSRLSQVFSLSCFSVVNDHSLLAFLCHAPSPVLCGSSCQYFLLQIFRSRVISIHDHSGQGSSRIYSYFHADLSAVCSDNSNAFCKIELLCSCQDLRIHLRWKYSQVRGI